MNLTDEEAIFFKRILSLKNRVLNSNTASLSGFLDLRSQDICCYAIKNDVPYFFYGGANEAEYKRLLISSYEINEEDFKISKLEIKYNKRFLELTHRKVLGTILSLGIKRESIGDIYIGEHSYVMVEEELEDFIMMNFTSIGHVPITLVRVNDLLLEEKEKESTIIFVSSLRIDKVISTAYKINRVDANEMIKEGLVKLNHAIYQNPSYALKENDLLSIRGKGRLSIKMVKGTTKSGNYALEIEKI